MRKLILMSLLLVTMAVIMATKSLVVFPYWNWNQQNIEDFEILKQVGWFGENSFYQAATTDILLIPSDVTSTIEDFPYSVTELTEPAEDLDFIAVEGLTVSLERWEDRERIKRLFEEYENFANYDRDYVPTLVHPAFLHNGIIREELDFSSLARPFKVVINSIQIINQFAVVDATNLYMYVEEIRGVPEIRWYANGDLPAIAQEGLYFLVYECATTGSVAVEDQSCSWWFFGNQAIPEDENDNDGSLGGRGWSSDGDSNIPSANTSNDGDTVFIPEPGVTVLGGLDGFFGLNQSSFDNIYDGDLTEYRFCKLVREDVWICVLVIRIVRGVNSITCNIGASFLFSRVSLHNEMMFIRPAQMELHKQPTGEWLALPEESPVWFRRIKKVILEGEPKKLEVELWQNGEFLGRPQFNRNR